MNTEKEILFFQKRLLESANLAYQKGIVVYTDFLGLAEQDLFFRNLHQFPPVSYSCYGGKEEAERYCICFDGSMDSFSLRKTVAAEPQNFPIICIRITPSAFKFSEVLTHRDYLGAILHLGIARTKIGDIYVKEKEAYVFCIASIADFLCRELITVKHTAVHTEIVLPEADLLKNVFKEISGTVASMRLDAFLPLAFQSSRSSLVSYIEGGKTYINGRLATKSGEILVPGDIVSVRGMGRFQITDINQRTRKGRISVTIKKYSS